jgi:molybdopterin-guanine dinucleotide biosynthesis protein A
LGGVVTAVRWSADLGHEGVLVLACDLPLVTSELLDLLISEWDGRSVVAPASSGPLGLEPLVAVYPRTILESFETALLSGTRAMGTALQLVPTKMVSADRIAALGDPQRLFLNVNRPGDRERAERALINGGG